MGRLEFGRPRNLLSAILERMDIEKTMEFILGIQAQLESTAKEHHERIAKLESGLVELRSSVATVTDLVGRLAQAEIRLAESTKPAFRNSEKSRRIPSINSTP